VNSCGQLRTAADTDSILSMGTEVLDSQAASGAAVPIHLSPAQVADALGISTRTLQRMRADGIGPSFVVVTRGCIRYPAHVVAEWLDGRTIDPADATAAVDRG
jgi:hypothetical protein